MTRWLACGLLAGILGTIGTNVSLGQTGKAPRGYIFFAPRNRPAASVKTGPAKTVQSASAKSDRAARPATPTKADGGPLSASAQKPEAKPVSQVTWDSDYDPAYGTDPTVPLPGSSLGYSQYSYGFGAPHAFPLHGYRSTYYWFGHTYTMHCYCGAGECPGHCPGYRGECFVPGWNDAGTMIFENPCGRGSCLDWMWHKGGYERPCRRIDCPNVCQGVPRYSSFGFPRGAAGDPNYVPPQGTKDDRIYKMPSDIYSIPKPIMVPETPAGPTIAPEPPADPMEEPSPKPQP
ncbi:MAG: hypothetical protein EXS05_10395 [Planctomycetaceae bacterium]|nr:hypothetical protein [Planctomycetaceae bacterium]